MASSSRVPSWTPILLEAAENVRSRVRMTLLNRPTLEVEELKRLLDAEAQQAILETLRKVGTPVQVISEEGDYTIGGGGVHIVVDPVDGTTNLARGIPLAVTSLAVSETPRLSGGVAGLVMNLYTGEVFRAERDRGAWRSGKRINTAKPRAVRKALISIDISKGAPLKPVERLIQEAGYLRQLGCAALSLCHVASGLMDAHVDIRGTMRATDVAAGLIILKEAGGIYTVDGAVSGDLDLSRESTLDLVAASNPGTIEEILGLLA